MKRLFITMVVLTFVGGASITTLAQLPDHPPENHYLVYNLEIPHTVFAPLGLRDQFGSYEVQSPIIQIKWGNPLELKNGEPVMWDPLLHHSWYELTEPIPNARFVTVEHQFGAYQLQLLDGRFLINPADKHDQIPGLPIGNHYLCYMARGEPLEIPLELVDQW